MTFAELAGLRQGMYAALGSLFRLPVEDGLRQAAMAAPDLNAVGDNLRGLAFEPAWCAFRQQLLAIARAEATARDASWCASLDDGELRESRYASPDAEDQIEVVADVEASYRRAGLRHAGPRAADHLGTELSFLSAVCGREAEAWEAGRRDLVVASLRAQVRFLGNHLCRWLPLVAARLVRDEWPDLYVRAARAAHALAIHDRDMAPLLMAELGEDCDVR